MNHAYRFFSAGRKRIFRNKLQESAVSVLPIVLVVAALCLLAVPAPTDLMLAFLIGSIMVIVGMALFTLGSENSLTNIGSHMSSALTKSKKLPLILSVSFALGVFVTVAEPDLKVLAETVPHINTALLIAVVGVGVGAFLALAMARMIFGIKLRYLLLISYAVVFGLSLFAPAQQLAMAFDSGGVTTGPMTVPFVLAFGVGVSYIRSDRRAESDSFGLVALCSIGPVLAVMLLSCFFRKAPAGDGAQAVDTWKTTTQLGHHYLRAIPGYMLEIALSLSPVLAAFALFQMISLHLKPRACGRILLGLLITYGGLVLFLTGVNVGFSALGRVLGSLIAQSAFKYLLIPLSAILGWFIISAEPAVFTLEKQIEKVSAGAIPGKSVRLSLSVAISAAMALSMTRVLTGVSIMYFLVPGYALALALSFFVPDLYTAIAFDSGGVASGPMTATFMLQFMLGASEASGGNPLSDAFGVVALVAMMPLISVQLMGAAAKLLAKRRKTPDASGDEEIIEIMEARR